MNIQYLVEAVKEIKLEGKDSLEYEIDETTQLIEDGEDVEINQIYLRMLKEALES